MGAAHPPVRVRHRVFIVVLALLTLAGCKLQSLDGEPSPGGGGDNGVNLGCVVPADCVPAASTCCACPTFAQNAGNVDTGCRDVDCPAPGACPDQVATCEVGQCALVCRAFTTAKVCQGGFVRDAAGCLTEACAGPDTPIGTDCKVAGDCTVVAADCCGCQLGGAVTAVPTSRAETFTMGLGCTGTRTCPGVDVCDPTVIATCVNGHCLLAQSGGAGPADAGVGDGGAADLGYCGTPDYPACPTGQACVLNDPTAKAAGDLGVGICRPM